MIAVRLMGGLGNQMFQYAIARKLAHDRRTIPYLDLQFYENQAAVDTPRDYELGCFKLKPRFLTPAKRPSDAEPNYIGRRGHLRRISHSLQGKLWHVYREPHHHFDPTVLAAPDKTYLIGYWQCDKYFSDIRELLLADFSPGRPIMPKDKKILNSILSTDSVSLHVRRGDYVSNPNANAHHGTMADEYYNKAVNFIQKTVKDPTIFVFSDDMEWCKKNLNFSQKVYFVEGLREGWVDMYLMSKCKHNIIANSSFSWWGAWLNTNADKIVVAPKTWFKNQSVDTSDQTPKEWKRL